MSDRPFREFFEAEVSSAVEFARRRMREGDAAELAGAILRELASESSWRRQLVLERLNALGDYTLLLPPLTEALGDGRDAERRNAARSALAVLASPDAGDPDLALEQLCDLAKDDPDPDVRVLAVATLGEAAQPRARPLLEELLLDSDPNVSSAAAESLGLLADPRAVPALVDSASDADFWTRAAALVALGRLGDRRALPVLSSAVEEPWLSAAASQALADIGDPEGLEPLRRALVLKGEAREEALRAAACILGSNPEMEAPAWLREALRGSEAHLEGNLRDSADSKAARLLGLAGSPRAAQALLDQLEVSGHEEVAAIGLGLLPPAVAIEAILRRLDAADASGRTLLLASLPPLNDASAVRRVAEWLADPDPETQAAAAEALGRSDRTTVLKVLPPLLEHPDARVGAARVFGHFGPEACAPLIDLLDDPEPRVRATAAEGLGRCGSPHLPRILAAIRREEDAQTRQALVSALGRIGGEEAATALLPLAAAEDPALRFVTIRALGESRADSAFPALLDALLDPRPEIQAAALHALGELGDARAEKPLSERLDDPNRDLRRTAVLALDRIPPPASLERLREALSDPDREVRLVAARALQRLPSSETEEALDGAANFDPDPLVRQTAARAVDQLRRDDGGKTG